MNEIENMKQHTYNEPIPPNPYNPLAWVMEGAKIGKNCWIGAGAVIYPGVEIGDNVSVSVGAKIIDHDTSWYRVSEGRVPVRKYRVCIGDFTQIGANAVIVPRDEDIYIGDHCIIGALSFVNRSVSPYSVVVGIPARVVKVIDVTEINSKTIEYYEELK